MHRGQDGQAFLTLILPVQKGLFQILICLLTRKILFSKFTCIYVYTKNNSTLYIIMVCVELMLMVKTRYAFVVDSVMARSLNGRTIKRAKS